ncbi:sulfite exporter TauE/SafE family protein [Candidatus Campbellbacteria bacterium]|jgi:sulfite exporter TauE/SafE/copper chaperone CopZ|nr:MAG: sulfite exporter TauE/SafE family protein [Candidatus Campbellbacteria bacterium]
MKNYTLHVSGTHCASCKILIEDILGNQDMVKGVHVNLKKEIVHIDTDSNSSPEELASLLTEKIKSHGYTLSVDKIIKEKQSDDIIWKAIPIGLVFLVLFFILQKSGILNLGIGGKTTPATSFIIGLIASVSSCLAIVGGLVLSLSAKVMQDDGKSAKKPFILFHLGRVLGFALLGGLLGLIGKAIGINFMFSAILGLIASTVMILLGLNLVGVFKKSKLTLPSNLFAYFRKVEHATIAPILIGIGTFFLPCGFTQSMQVAALSSGSFISGMGLMLAFALGTLPMLALLSFSSVSFAHSKHAPLFFKSAGVVVIGLGIFALLAGLAGIGIISPLFNI